MHRFFLPKLLPEQSRVQIVDKAEVHHIRDVLRLQKGAVIRLFNGKGLEIQARISAIQKDSVEAHIEKILSTKVSKQKELILACALPKKAKFEYILEKVTELGVDEIVPLLTQRTEVKISGDKKEKKAQRYQKIALNAAKQSQRNIVPFIHPVTKLEPFLDSIGNDAIAFIPWLEGKRQSIHKAIAKASSKDIRKIIFLIGPEGDFTPQEITIAQERGCLPLSLGETVLKVDTAAISVIAFAKFYLLTKN